MKKLICFPHSGASKYVFNEWFKHIDSKKIKIIPFELPGRGERSEEKYLTRLDDVVKDAYDTLAPNLKNDDFCVFGHSLGAIVGFEFINKTNSILGINPSYFFASGMEPPSNFKKSKLEKFGYSDYKLMQYLKKIGGVPKNINNEDFMNIFLPVIKADFNLIDKYYSNTTLKTNIVTLNGDQDLKVAEITKWKNNTEQKRLMHFFSGNHFYLNDEDNKKAVSDIINYYMFN